MSDHESDRDVTLDDFWLGNVGLANLAGQLLTERNDARDAQAEHPADSIWRNDPYGSVIIALLERGAGPELIRRELERVLAVTQLGGIIESVTDSGADLRALDVRISITADTVAATAVTTEDP